MTDQETPGTISHVAADRICVRRLPLLRNAPIRTATGLAVVMLSIAVAWSFFDQAPRVAPVVLIVVVWLPGVWLADKYAHKYPQRYFTYLLASHFKAAVVSGIVLAVITVVADLAPADAGVLWTAMGLIIVTDALLSLLNRLDPKEAPLGTLRDDATGRTQVGPAEPELGPSDTIRILKQLSSTLDPALAAFLNEHLPKGTVGDRNVRVVEQASAGALRGEPGVCGLLICGPRLNDLRRLNRFLLACGNRITMGGYLVSRYVSHDRMKQELREHYPGWRLGPARLVHFAWRRMFPKLPVLNRLYFVLTNGKNRVFSKTEIWGRLSYCGMRVVAETAGGRETLLLAQRVGPPALNRRPSYYPVVALEKVGLNGTPLRTHKLRSMFPFSEFLQKRIFEDQGLASTGKFANDYRLTEYGAFIRRYWLDELPQIYDWIRGDLKLVGMRATSRQYLTLYPWELYELYVQTKPGLIPPIFDESTSGLDGIVAVELEYLRRYWRSPFRTDVRYFVQTLTDIFLRGVRSK